jgi:PEP-CTERM motif-containing protein
MFRNAFVLLLLIGLGSLTTFADTVTFEDAGCNNCYPIESGNSFTSDGYNFQVGTLLDSAYVILDNGQLCGPTCAVNGTTILQAVNRPTIIMSRTDGKTFDASQFDLGGHDGGVFDTDYVLVTGTLADHTTVTEAFNLTDTSNFHTMLLSSQFANLVSLEFSGHLRDGYAASFELDNIGVSTPVEVVTTPEPASLALLGSGMLGLAGIVRRKIKR